MNQRIFRQANKGLFTRSTEELGVQELIDSVIWWLQYSKTGSLKYLNVGTL